VDGFDGASGSVKLHYAFTPAALFTLTTSSEGGGQVSPSSGAVCQQLDGGADRHTRASLPSTIGRSAATSFRQPIHSRSLSLPTPL